MERYKVTIKGKTPIVFNTRQEKLDLEISKLEKNRLAEWEKTNWRKKALRDDKGNIIIPIVWIKSAFENACKHSRIIPHFATSKKETYTRYAGSMFFDKSSFRCSEKDLELISSYMGGQGAGSKTKVLKYFPKITKWETSFEIADPEGRMNISELKSLLEYAGLFEGIGDFRRVNCGRFEVTSINKTK